MHREQFLKLAVMAALFSLVSCRPKQADDGDTKTSGGGGSPVVQLTDEQRAEIAKATQERIVAEQVRAKERQRAAEEEKRRRLRLVYDALMRMDRFDLVKGGLDEWGVTVTVTEKDPERLQFTGQARLRWSALFEDVEIDGRVGEEGQVVITGIEPAAPVMLESVSSVGTIAGGDWSVEPWNARRRSMREEQEALATRLREEGVPSHTVSIWNREELPARMKLLEPVSARGKTLPAGGAAGAWINGNLRDRYHLKSGKSVSIRFPNAPKVGGLLFLALLANAHGKSIEGTRCRINGVSLIGIPTVYCQSACYVAFEEPVELWEVQIETGSGMAAIREILLVPADFESGS
jgi:hypothetical protein